MMVVILNNEVTSLNHQIRLLQKLYSSDVNGPHFAAQPGRSPTFIVKARFMFESQIYWVIQYMRNCELRGIGGAAK